MFHIVISEVGRANIQTKPHVYAYVVKLLIFVTLLTITYVVQQYAQKYCCISMATVVTRIHHSVRLYVYYSSFLILDEALEYLKLKLNSVALVRTRTIPTVRPPPVGEVSANFCG